MSEPRTANVNIRVEPSRLARWQAAAATTGRTLSEFLRAGADSEVEYSRQAAALTAALREQFKERRRG